MSGAAVRKCCLTIAGSDSGGNAGMQADLRVFHDYGLHGCTVVTALTAQNPFRVSAVHPLPGEFVAAELDAVLGVYSIAALKTGMMAGAESIAAVADRLSSRPEIAKVVDPVMIATSGAKLVDDDSIEAVRRLLLPMATVATPNIPEAEALCGVSSGDGSAGHAAELARRMYGLYGCRTLVKGGHAGGSEAVDVLFDGEEAAEFAAPRIANPASTHGTGCSLAAALAAELALGADLRAAAAGAKRYVHGAIASSYFVGEKCGVLGSKTICGENMI